MSRWLSASSLGKVGILESSAFCSSRRSLMAFSMAGTLARMSVFCSCMSLDESAPTPLQLGGSLSSTAVFRKKLCSFFRASASVTPASFSFYVRLRT